MATQEYSFPTNRPDQPGGGVTPQVSDEKAPDNLRRPVIPQLEPAIRGIAENAGFPAETLEGEALLAKTLGGAENVGALRDGDNARSLGNLPDYPVNVMDQAFSGHDLRNFGAGEPAALEGTPKEKR
jgi:hypothetical protein